MRIRLNNELSTYHKLFSVVNFGGKLPLNFYNLLNEEMHRREEARDYGLAPGVNQDLANPNALNRPFAWPMMIKSSMNRDDQVGY